MRPLRPFALEVFFSKWEFTARYHLCASDMQSMTISDLLAMADAADRSAWDQLYLGYTETWGSPTLRETIAATYDTITSDQVLSFVGAEEGIFAAMHALLGPDDHAITVIPNYQSVESVPLSICDTTGIALDPKNNWNLDLDQVRDAIRPNTRVICVNFPHNPTGKIISRQDLDSLIAMARPRGIYIFSDEVYRPLERRPEIRLPQVADLYERGLSLGVMSKAYGLPGIRVGWVACKDVELLGMLERLKHYTSLCSPAPSELLAQIALKSREKILTRNRALVTSNLLILEAFRRTRAPLRVGSARRRLHRLSPLPRPRRGRDLRKRTRRKVRRAASPGQRLPIRSGRHSYRPLPGRLRPRKHGRRPRRHAQPPPQTSRLTTSNPGCGSSQSATFWSQTHSSVCI